MANIKGTPKPPSFWKTHRLAIILSLVFMTFISYVLNYFQKLIYCKEAVPCYFWGGLSGFFLTHLLIGWVLCVYVWFLITHTTLSPLLKMLFPLVLIIYSVSILNFFYYYGYIKNDTVYLRHGLVKNEQTVNISNIKSMYFVNYPMIEGGYYQAYYLNLNSGGKISFSGDFEEVFDTLMIKYNMPLVTQSGFPVTPPAKK